MSFDPYTQWLHLPPGPRPPRVWELLGLREGEADQEQIRQAVLRRYAQVRPYQTGSHAKDADRVLGEISQALNELTGPHVPPWREGASAGSPPPLPGVDVRQGAPSPPGDASAGLPPVVPSPLSAETWKRFFADDAPAPEQPAKAPLEVTIDGKWLARMAAVAGAAIVVFAIGAAVYTMTTGDGAQPQVTGARVAEREPPEEAAGEAAGEDEPAGHRPSPSEFAPPEPPIADPDPGSEEAAGAALPTEALAPPGTAPTAGGGPAEEIAPAEDGTWEGLARQFARQNAGVFLDNVPLTDGRAGVAPGTLPAGAGASRLCLGPGEIVFGGGTYPFGGGFPPREHVTRREVPGLAEELGLASVYVEVLVRPGGPFVALTGAARPWFMETTTAQREQTRLRARQSEISALAAIAQSPTAGSFQKQKALSDLIALVVPLPEIPDPQAPEFVKDPDAFREATARYRSAVGAQSEVRRDAVPRVQRELARLKEEIAALDRTAVAQRSQEEALAALDRLRREAQRISVVLYRGPVPSPPGQG